jgi:hypothetical protein
VYGVVEQSIAVSRTIFRRGRQEWGYSQDLPFLRERERE